MGQALSKQTDQAKNVIACCKKVINDPKFRMIIEKTVRFTAMGLGKGASIFAAIYAGSRNKRPSPNQIESYQNQNNNVYKPGYYNIQPKPMNSQFGSNSGSANYAIQYEPEVDPNKLKRGTKQLGNFNYGYNAQGNGFQNENAYDNLIRQRLQSRRNQYFDQNITQVSFSFSDLCIKKLSNFGLETGLQWMDQYQASYASVQSSLLQQKPFQPDCS